MSTWPRHPDGRNKTIGEMAEDEVRAVTGRAAAVIQAELDDPLHPTRRTVEAILHGSVTTEPAARH